MKVLQEIKVPQESVNDQFLTVMQLFHAHGAKVSTGDSLLELETSKATLTLESNVDGYVEYLCNEGDEVEVNSTIIRIFNSSDFLSKDKKPGIQHVQPENSAEQTLHLEPVFSRAALDLVNARNIPLSKFAGNDFVNVHDVKLYLNEVPEVTKTVTGPSTLKQQQVHHNIGRSTPLTKSKQREIEYLSAVQSASLNSLVHTVVNTYGISMVLNKSLKLLKDSILPLIVYEAARLLKIYEVFNAFYTGGQISFYDKVNVGIAMDIDDGLKTVKIDDANKKSLNQIEIDIFTLSEKYLDKKLQVKDMTDITFTITDLSAYDVHSFVPLINKNNAAILGISSPNEKGDMVLTLAFDHRVSAGKDAAQYLRDLKERLESYKQDENYNISETIQCVSCNRKLSNDLSTFGFIKVVGHDGKEALLCQSCFKGF